MPMAVMVDDRKDLMPFQAAFTPAAIALPVAMMADRIAFQAAGTNAMIASMTLLTVC